MALKLNQEGFAHAKKLISEGKTDLSTKWSSGEPTTQSTNEFLSSHNFKEYGKWFLAINQNEPENSKAHYEFPYGNFSKLLREGVIAAEHRAGQYHHTEIEAAAKQLLQMIREKETAKR